MSRGYWNTPEEVIRRKKVKNKLIYGLIMLGTVIISTLVTFLTNQI